MTTQPIKRVLTLTPNPAIDMMLCVEYLRIGEVNKGQESYSRAGGKGINVVTALAELNSVDSPFGKDSQNIEVSLVATGWLGADNAQIFQQHFRAYNIVDEFVRVMGETRTNIKITASADNDTTDVNFAGIRIESHAQQQLQQVMAEQPVSDDICVLAGSLPEGVAVDFYVQAITDMRKKGQLVILDTSGQPLNTVIESKAFPQVMKPNIHELSAFNGEKLADTTEILQLVTPWFSEGLELLTVSLGAEGALFITADEVVKVLPQKIKVTTTVGAGDAMVAGICQGLLQGLSLSETAKLATALSIAKITKLEQGLSLSKRVKQLLPTIKTQEISIRNQD